MKRFKTKLLSACAALALGLSAVTVTMTLTAPPAHAITVFDPANYSQNLLTAVRSLQQISNQIQQLANEAQMLVNQAQNLTSLPTASPRFIPGVASRSQSAPTPSRSPKNAAFASRGLPPPPRGTRGSGFGVASARRARRARRLMGSPLGN